MSLQPLLQASLAIQLHTVAALSALVLGIVQLSLPKGTALHRVIGWIWITLMTLIALSSFFIHEIRLLGLWSPIHLLSILTLVLLVLALRAVRQGNIKAHRNHMLGLFIFALIGAGVFTLMLGRIMHSVVWGG